MEHDVTNDPFYPMPFGAGREIHRPYQQMARQIPRTIFAGRLATYCYLDMWMAVAQVIVRLKDLLCEGDKADLLKNSKPENCL